MHSKSLGTGRVSDGTLTLRPNASAEDHEQFQSHSWEEREQRAYGGGRTSQAGDDAKPPTEQSIIGYEQPIMLTQRCVSELLFYCNVGMKYTILYRLHSHTMPIIIVALTHSTLQNQSTHSFLFTEPTCSVPFWFAMVVIAISYTCLLLALFNNLFDDYSPGNPLSVPVGVTFYVKIAQYLALLIGLISK